METIMAADLSFRSYGDTGVGKCETCGRERLGQYVYREASTDRGEKATILALSCNVCYDILEIPPQSRPSMKKVPEVAPKNFDGLLDIEDVGRLDMANYLAIGESAGFRMRKTLLLFMVRWFNSLTDQKRSELAEEFKEEIRSIQNRHDELLSAGKAHPKARVSAKVTALAREEIDQAVRHLPAIATPRKLRSDADLIRFLAIVALGKFSGGPHHDPRLFKLYRDTLFICVN